ncbi:MAG: hypothetical protein IJ202_04550 [Bacteroidales bacterium]|nr:hypothetical protein [Bacteroidales bacterium]
MIRELRQGHNLADTDTRRAALSAALDTIEDAMELIDTLSDAVATAETESPVQWRKICVTLGSLQDLRTEAARQVNDLWK